MPISFIWIKAFLLQDSFLSLPEPWQALKFIPELKLANKFSLTMALVLLLVKLLKLEMIVYYFIKWLWDQFQKVSINKVKRDIQRLAEVWLWEWALAFWVQLLLAIMQELERAQLLWRICLKAARLWVFLQKLWMWEQ